WPGPPAVRTAPRVAPRAPRPRSAGRPRRGRGPSRRGGPDPTERGPKRSAPGRAPSRAAYGRPVTRDPRGILPGSMSTDIRTAQLALPVEGMTCASCVNRIERFLKRPPGVEDAVVNLATEVATIRYLPEQVGRTELVGAIEA